MLLKKDAQVFKKSVLTKPHLLYILNIYSKHTARWKLNILISNSSGQPIYSQIADQIKSQIMSGALPAGEALPSMRLLAKELRISLITTKRAYEELERDGFICAVPGKGCFVAERDIQLIREENLRKIEEHMREIAALAIRCQLNLEEVKEMFSLIFEEETP